MENEIKFILQRKTKLEVIGSRLIAGLTTRWLELLMI